MKYIERLKIISEMQADWGVEGSNAPKPEVVRSAKEFIDCLMVTKNCGFLSMDFPVYGEPDDIYALPDGNLLLEWQYPDGEIRRLEIEEAGKGELMVTFPGKANVEARFETINWGA